MWHFSGITQLLNAFVSVAGSYFSMATAVSSHFRTKESEWVSMAMFILKGDTNLIFYLSVTHIYTQKDFSGLCGHKNVIFPNHTWSTFVCCPRSDRPCDMKENAQIRIHVFYFHQAWAYHHHHPVSAMHKTPVEDIVVTFVEGWWNSWFILFIEKSVVTKT